MTGLQIFDEYGAPLASGAVHLFEQSQWNTRVMAVSYRGPSLDDAGVNTNPVILNMEGRARIYLRPGYYEVEVRDAGGRLLPGYPQAVVVQNPPTTCQPHGVVAH